METIFESDHCLPAGEVPRNFDRVLDRLSATGDKESLLGKISRRPRVQFLRQPDITLIGRHHKAGVNELIDLLTDRGGGFWENVTGILTADAAGKIEHLVAVDILDCRP